MKYKEMIESLEIFAEYDEDGLKGEVNLNAQHDMLFAPFGPTEIKPNSKDGKRLKKLGWYPDKGYDSWMIFT